MDEKNNTLFLYLSLSYECDAAVQSLYRKLSVLTHVPVFNTSICYTQTQTEIEYEEREILRCCLFELNPV